MKVSMQMLRDLGVCDGANQYIGDWFAANNVEVIDYDFALQTLLDYQEAGQEWIDANYAGTEHSDYAGWVQWMRELSSRHDAITYFGDHTEENLFRTDDTYLHETLSAAQAHRARVYQELRDDHASKRVINGVKVAANGAETWSVIDLHTADVSEFDAFVWHDAKTGLNHRTVSPTVAAVFDAEQQKILHAINAAEQAAKIERKITDESGQYSVWVEVEE